MFVCEEVASGPDREHTGDYYWGLFWQGNKPNQNKILELLKQEGLDFDGKDEDGDPLTEVHID